MNTSRITALGACTLCVALVAGQSSAAAQSTDQPLSRAQVRQGAIDARKAGQLRVGDDPYYPYGRETTVAKPLRLKAKKPKDDHSWARSGDGTR